MKRTTIATILFWSLFVGSFGLYKRYPLVDTIWVVTGRLCILALAVFTLVKAYKDHGKTGTFSYQGYPRWLLRFLIDEEDQRQQQDKPNFPSHRSTP